MTDNESGQRNPRKSSSSVNYRTTLNESARLLRANRPGEAIAVLEPLHEDLPNDPDIAINLGGALILQRKWSKAVRILKKPLMPRRTTCCFGQTWRLPIWDGSKLLDRNTRQMPFARTKKPSGSTPAPQTSTITLD